jgi:AcrR family transcriptional regulator
VPRRTPTLSLDAVLAGLQPDATPNDESTEAMLDATSTLLASYGMKRWAVDDVAHLAGLGRATVYRRFDSRDDLVHATLARDMRRFFATIAEEVNAADTIEDKLVEGLLVGMRLARESVVPSLLAGELADLAPLFPIARAALVDRFEIMTETPLGNAERSDAELIAEVLVRLGLSFVLVPGPTIDLDHPAQAREALRRVVSPLLARGG